MVGRRRVREQSVSLGPRVCGAWPGRSAGYRITDEAYDKAVNYVKTQVAQSAVTDYETKAVLLHALTVAGHSDFPLANALYRNRPSLSAAALAYLALTFADMDRKQTAGELLTLLGNQPWDGRRGRPEPETRSEPARPASLAPCNSWNLSPAEIRAIYRPRPGRRVARGCQAAGSRSIG